jgi:hypothetical protein
MKVFDYRETYRRLAQNLPSWHRKLRKLFSRRRFTKVNEFECKLASSIGIFLARVWLSFRRIENSKGNSPLKTWRGILQPEIFPHNTRLFDRRPVYRLCFRWVVLDRRKWISRQRSDSSVWRPSETNADQRHHRREWFHDTKWSSYSDQSQPDSSWKNPKRENSRWRWDTLYFKHFTGKFPNSFLPSHSNLLRHQASQWLFSFRLSRPESVGTSDLKNIFSFRKRLQDGMHLKETWRLSHREIRRDVKSRHV